MADFLPAYKALRRLEGAPGRDYSNDPADPGGETFAGIARKYHPDAAIWPAIDACKGYSDFPACLYRPALSAKLELAIEAFYMDEFWTPNRLYDFPEQPLANEVFEQAVNLGSGTATAILQTAANALNNHGKRWGDITVDGSLGGKTIAVVHAAHWQKLGDTLRKAINCLQGCHYLKSRNERFMVGWLTRVSL